ncbi:PRTase-like protein [Violaceomyces palustris]|uniref:PRTase-like protein n=1 Tax=Violaceomyces palustris TaxID=1673888 RepID=A0ACD0P5V4_9BASI|nr:PRTase-like protein [Violaceomyces palustris]
MSTSELPDDHFRPTYEEIHVQIGEAAQRIKNDFDPDLMVAIGGGGFYPARVLRTFLKKPSALDPSKLRNIPIQAIGLSLYEEVSGTSEGQIGNEVVRTQWLDAKTVSGKGVKGKIEEGKDAGGLLGKNVLIVDEVDDSRTTLQYAYNELLKDVRSAISALSEEEKKDLAPTRFAIFVVHNKNKEKRGTLPMLPDGLPKEQEEIQNGVCTAVRYFAGAEIDDVWCCYPWEETDIIEHNRLAALAKEIKARQASTN